MSFETKHGRPEPTRTRENGRKVTHAKTPDERIAAIRAIVDTSTFAKVDGCMVDLFSASAIIAVYDALNTDNRAKFAGLSVHRMASVAFKFVK